jgi:hypothetical protein
MNRIGGTSTTKATNENRLILTSSKSPFALKMLAKRGGIQNGAFPTDVEATESGYEGDPDLAAMLIAARSRH